MASTDINPEWVKPQSSQYDWNPSRLSESNVYQNAVSEQASRIEQGFDVDLDKRSNTMNALKAQAGGASLAMIRNIDAFNKLDFNEIHGASPNSNGFKDAERFYGRAEAGLSALMQQMHGLNGGDKLGGSIQIDEATGKIIGVNLERNGNSVYKTIDQFKTWANDQFGVAPTEQQLAVENFEKQQKQQNAMRMINGLATIEKAKDFLSGAYYAYKNSKEDDPNRAQYETQWNNAKNMLVDADVDPDLIDAYMSSVDARRIADDAEAKRKAEAEEAKSERDMERDLRKTQNTITIAEAAEARRVAREAEKMKTPQGMLDIVNKQIEAWKGLPPDTPGRDAQIKSLLLTQKNIAEAAGIPYVEVGDVDDDDTPTGDLSEGL